MNLDKLKKLLCLTQSNNDHEALSAIRMVNKIIKEHGKTWDDVFNFKEIIYEERVVYKKPEHIEEVEEILEYCLDHAGLNSLEFLCSLKDAHQKWGKLTYRQESALRKIYNRITGQESDNYF